MYPQVNSDLQSVASAVPKLASSYFDIQVDTGVNVSAEVPMSVTAQSSMWSGSSQAYLEKNDSKEWHLLSASGATEKSVIISKQQQEITASSDSSSDALLNSTPLGVNGGSVNLPEDSSFLEAAASWFFSVMLWSLTGVLILTILWQLLCIWWRRRILRSAEDPSSPLAHLPLPPGDLGYPMFGETWAWFMEGTAFNSNRRKKYGKVFKTNVLFDPMVKVSGHDFVKEVLSSEHDKVTTDWPYTIRKSLGELTVANSTGQMHYHRRKIATKAFTREALNNYAPVIRKECQNMMEGLKQCEEPKILKHVEKMTFNIALSVLVGLQMGDTQKRNELREAFLAITNNLLSLPFNIPGLGLNKALKGRERLFKILQELLVEKRTQLSHQWRQEKEGVEESTTEKIRDAFSNIHVDVWRRQARLGEETNSNMNNNNNNLNKNNMEETKRSVSEEALYQAASNDLAMKEMVLELMFAGHATTSSVLTSAIMEVSNHPEVFRNMEEEMLRHGLLSDSPSKDITSEEELELSEIHQLTYLDQVLKETLRKRPAVLGGYRRAKKTFQLGEYRIPKGWKVLYNILDTHECEDGDMNQFDPDRFASTADGKQTKYRFLPFGCGPRVCLGQEFARLVIKLSLIEFVRHFRRCQLTGANPPKMSVIPTIRPSDGLPARLDAREVPGVL